MGKYRFLNSDEIIAEIEKFGTEDERDIVAKIKIDLTDLRAELENPNWEDCPECDDRDQAGKNAFEKLEEAQQLISDAQDALA